MAKIELSVSIYPTVWTVVLKDHGLPKGEVVESIWATERLAQAQAYTVHLQDPNLEWEVVPCQVGAGGEAHG